MDIAQGQTRASLENFCFSFASLLEPVHLRQPFTRSIGRSIIDDDDFIRDANCLYAPQDLLYEISLVICSNDNGNGHGSPAVRICVECRGPWQAGAPVQMCEKEP